MQNYNREPLEFGKSASGEFYAGEEQCAYAENSYTEQSMPNDEYASVHVSTSVKDKKREQRQKTNLTQLITSAVAVAAVAVVNVGGFMSVDASASIVEYGGEYDRIFYHIEVVGEGSVKAVLYNDFTERTVELNEGEHAGSFESLKPGLKYTLAVVQEGAFGDKTLIEKVVYTSKVPTYVPKTEWYGVSHECTCNVDGRFHFTMEFVDELGYYSDFKATLTDAQGNVGICTFTDDLKGEQSIDITVENYLVGNTATFVIACTSTEGGVSREIELYRSEVKI